MLTVTVLKMINDFLFARGFTLFPYDFYQDEFERKMKFSYTSRFISGVENWHFRVLCSYLNTLSVLDIIRKIAKTHSHVHFNQ